MERLIVETEWGFAPEKVCKMENGKAYDCKPCFNVCDENSCKTCPINEAFFRLWEYEETGVSIEQLKADKWKYDGSREESSISDEILYRAVNTQVEFLRRYRERYDDEPEFDIVILKIMLELKERRAAERKNGHNETD
ncbi:MAG: hypothetical protein K2G20_07315 [Lachnospiraceae bacterium]|nr:hypothetical protein [Lachnospiraceae bacterium]